MSKTTSFLCVFSCFLATACAKSSGADSDSPTAKVPAAGADTVVATYTGGKVTMADLDKSIKTELAKLEEQKYSLRRDGAERLVMEALLEVEAAKQGTTIDVMLEQIRKAKTAPPTQEEIEAFFKARVVPQMGPETKLEDHLEPIVRYLGAEADRKTIGEFFEKIRTAGNVAITLERPVRPRVELKANGPSKGPENAPVTLVEFADFECPYCARVGELMDEVSKAYPGKVRIVFKHFPLSFHPNAAKAAEASLCAHAQNKFWEYHDLLFKNQRSLGVEKLKVYASELGLDGAAFNDCLDKGQFTAQVQADFADGQAAGVQGTPALYINGIALESAGPLERIKEVVEEELASLK